MCCGAPHAACWYNLLNSLRVHSEGEDGAAGQARHLGRHHPPSLVHWMNHQARAALQPVVPGEDLPQNYNSYLTTLLCIILGGDAVNLRTSEIAARLRHRTLGPTMICVRVGLACRDWGFACPKGGGETIV